MSKPSLNDRSKRIELIEQNLEEEQEADLEEFRASASLGMGVTESKIQEYLEQLDKAGKINIEDKKVVYNG